MGVPCKNSNLILIDSLKDRVEGEFTAKGRQLNVRMAIRTEFLEDTAGVVDSLHQKVSVI